MKRLTRSTQFEATCPNHVFDLILPSSDTPYPAQRQPETGLLTPSDEPRWMSSRPTVQPRSRKSVPNLNHSLYQSIWSDKPAEKPLDASMNDVAPKPSSSLVVRKHQDIAPTPLVSQEHHDAADVSHHIAGLLHGALANMHLGNCTFEIKVNIHHNQISAPTTQSRGDDGLALKRKRAEEARQSEEDHRLAKKLKLTQVGNERGKGRQSGRLLRMAARRKSSRRCSDVHTLGRR